MPNKSEAAAAPQDNNTLAQPETADAFLGVTTKDGEVVHETPAAKAGNKAARSGGRAKGAPAPDDDGQGTLEQYDAQPAAGDEPEELAGEGKDHASAQDRINKAVRKQRNAERRLAATEDENRAMRARLDALEQRMNGAPPTQQQPAKPKKDPNAPQPDDYQYGDMDVSYIADLAKYNTRKEVEEEFRRRDEEQRNTQQRADAEKFMAKREKFMDLGDDIADDFSDVVTAKGLPFSQAMVELALDSEHGPRILYDAATDSQAVKALSAMSPARQAAWFGQKEAELSSTSQDADGEDDEDDGRREAQPSRRTPPTATRAPAPIGHSRGTTGSSATTAATPNFRAFEEMARSRNSRR